MGRAFSAQDVTWGAAPGWYSTGRWSFIKRPVGLINGVGDYAIDVDPKRFAGTKTSEANSANGATPHQPGASPQVTAAKQ